MPIVNYEEGTKQRFNENKLICKMLWEPVFVYLIVCT